jgi:hypothetical protein
LPGADIISHNLIVKEFKSAARTFHRKKIFRVTRLGAQQLDYVAAVEARSRSIASADEPEWNLQCNKLSRGKNHYAVTASRTSL